MRLLVDIVAVAIGLAAGLGAGYWIGRRWEADRRMLWTMAGVAFATAWAVDLAGYVTGHPEVAIGSIGLMAGVVTGVKYGGVSPLRVLDPPPVADAPARDESAEREDGAEHDSAPASDRSDAPASEDADASQSREP